MVNAEVSSGGELSVAGQIIGRLQGFRWTPETNGGGDPAEKNSVDVVGALAQEFEVRANRLSEAVDSALVLANDGAVRWLGDPVAKITGGEKLLEPRALILADEALTETAQQKVQGRVDLWLNAYVHRLLGPLFELDTGVGLEGPARNVAKQLVEALGVLERGRVAQDVKALDQNARGMLRKLGVRFGAHYVFIPSLVKPAIRVLATQLWALRQNGAAAGAGLDEIPQLAASGRTSFVADSAIPKETYRVAGFRLCGERAVRVDIVERLADLIRPAITYRPGPGAGPPPPGSADGDGFVVTGAMTSLTGCSGEQFASVLRSLGFVSHQVKGPALTIAATAPEAAPTSGVATLEAEKNPAAEYAETALVEPAPPDPIEAPIPKSLKQRTLKRSPLRMTRSMQRRPKPLPKSREKAKAPFLALKKAMSPPKGPHRSPRLTRTTYNWLIALRPRRRPVIPSKTRRASARFRKAKRRLFLSVARCSRIM